MKLKSMLYNRTNYLDYATKINKFDILQGIQVKSAHELLMNHFIYVAYTVLVLEYNLNRDHVK